MARFPATTGSSKSKTQNFAHSLFARYWLFLVCWIAIGFVVWARFLLPWQALAWSFALLLVVGVLFDLMAWPLRWRTKIEQQLIPAGLLLLSTFPMLCSLFYAWAHHYVTAWSAGPLLPYSDAGGYVNGARWLLTFGQLGEWAARRPLGICLMSAVLGLTGQDYQPALIVFTLLAGISTFFAARETWRAGGVTAAVAYVALCYLAIIQWLPLFLTETTGYIFGSISYTFLLAGFRSRSFPKALFGFGFLILAVTARAGAMFTIPLLALYLIYYFSRNLRDSLRKSAVLIAAGGAILALGPLLVMRLAPAGTEYQGSLSYTLYGLAAGGRGWSYVLEEHPEIARMSSDGERSRYIYSLFKQRVSANPSLFVSTLLQTLGTALIQIPFVFYGLMAPIPLLIPGIFAILAFCLLLVPAWHRRGPWPFLIPVAIGVMLSTPFLFDGGLRTFMGTLPFQVALAVSAIGLILFQLRRVRVPGGPLAVSALSKEKNAQRQEMDETRTVPWVEAGFAILLFGTVTVFPLVVSLRPVPASVLSWSRDKSEGFRKEVVFYFNPGAGILLGDQPRVAGVMNVPVQAAAYAPMFGRELRAPEHLAAGDYLYHAFFLAEPEYGNVFVRFRSVPDVQPGYLRVRVGLLEESDGSFLYVADNYTRVDP